MVAIILTVRKYLYHLDKIWHIKMPNFEVVLQSAFYCAKCLLFETKCWVCTKWSVEIQADATMCKVTMIRPSRVHWFLCEIALLHIWETSDETCNAGSCGEHKITCLVLSSQLVSITNIPGQMPDAIDIMINQWESYNGLGRPHDQRWDIESLNGCDIWREVARSQEEAEWDTI